MMVMVMMMVLVLVIDSLLKKSPKGLVMEWIGDGMMVMMKKIPFKEKYLMTRQSWPFLRFITAWEGFEVGRQNDGSQQYMKTAS